MNSLLSDHQYGFRKPRSTGDLLSYLPDLWSSSLRDYGETFIIAVDLSKAVDRVWHKAVLASLLAYGFTPSLCNVIKSYLSDCYITVVVDGATFPKGLVPSVFLSLFTTMGMMKAWSLSPWLTTKIYEFRLM